MIRDVLSGHTTTQSRQNMTELKYNSWRPCHRIKIRIYSVITANRCGRDDILISRTNDIDKIYKFDVATVPFKLLFQLLRRRAEKQKRRITI